MRKTFFFLLLLLPFQLMQAQITKEDYDYAVNYIQSENWSKAYKVTNKLLEANGNDTSEYHQMVVYLNIYAATGLTAKGKMKQAELLETVSKYKGQPIFLAGHIASMDMLNTLNKTLLTTKNGKSNGFTIVTNKSLQILMLEDITFAKTVDPSYYWLHTARCGGILSNVELNTDETTTKDWILKLTVSNGFVRRTK